MLPNVVSKHKTYKYYLVALSHSRKTRICEQSNLGTSPPEVPGPYEAPHMSIKAHAKHVNEVGQEPIEGNQEH